MIPNREEAFAILKEYNESEALLRHGLTVEGCMRHFGEAAGEDKELWGVVGLLHDVDYEKWPEQHCTKARELLEAKGVDESIIHAVQAHGWGLCSDVEPVTKLEKTLFAIDELTGLITAAAIMRPSKSVMDLELKSVKKKYKDKKFAAGVKREVIEQGAEMLGTSVDDLINGCIEGMRECAEVIGLKGEIIEG